MTRQELWTLQEVQHILKHLQLDVVSRAVTPEYIDVTLVTAYNMIDRALQRYQ